jgi:hypothetical protein
LAATLVETKKTGKVSGEDKVCMFKAPTHRGSLIQWRAAIPRSDRTMSSKDHMCFKHTGPEDIIKERIIQGKEGNIVFPLLKWKHSGNI